MVISKPSSSFVFYYLAGYVKHDTRFDQHLLDGGSNMARAIELRVAPRRLPIWVAAFGIFLGACNPSAPSTRLAFDEPASFAYEEYDVRFTNPVCKTYKYVEEVLSVSGDRLRQKPQNAYCKASDKEPSARRRSSPFAKIQQWLSSPSTHSVFAAFLSFSNAETADLLCSALARGVDVTLVLYRGTELGLANSLKRCAERGRATFDLQLRGDSGGIDFAHNKILMINPDDDSVQLAFASGNLSSGVVLHHENWHFITAANSTYFMQAHQCLRRAMLEHADSKRQYSSFIQGCRNQIDAVPESDITTFFVPGEGDEALDTIENALSWADEVDVAAHRFSATRVIAMLQENVSSGGDVRLLLDDDIYWAGRGQTVGANTRDEFNRTQSLVRSGATVKYLETNHGISIYHHNKFLVFRGGRRQGLFVGAGNLTTAAFTNNLENFYYITNAEIVRKFTEQYRHLWDDLATAPNDMPRKNVLP